ncbi:hypothetical protein ACFWN1_31725 [Streptomyces sp. NPDC058459]|uniref:hypothetical protein n=1 Tax=Streptomyces sp. NPDC058459 TaxID=3346508 RepID=UPI003646E5AB
MDKIVGHAGSFGLKVVLDRRPDSSARSVLWYTSAVPESIWIGDLKALATRYRGDDAVVGTGPHDEPRDPARRSCGDRAADLSPARLDAHSGSHLRHEGEPGTNPGTASTPDHE